MKKLNLLLDQAVQNLMAVAEEIETNKFSPTGAGLSGEIYREFKALIDINPSREDYWSTMRNLTKSLIKSGNLPAAVELLRSLKNLNPPKLALLEINLDIGIIFEKLTYVSNLASEATSAQQNLIASNKHEWLIKIIALFIGFMIISIISYFLI